MATESGKVTNFKNVDVVVSGVPGFGFRVDAFTEGTAISIAPQGDINTVTRGNDGIDTFAEVPSVYVIVTLSLSESSDSNDKLSAWLAAGHTMGISYVDRNGRTVCSTSTARIRQYATTTKLAGVSVSAWDIHCPGAQYFVGGLNNPTPPTP